MSYVYKLSRVSHLHHLYLMDLVSYEQCKSCEHRKQLEITEHERNEGNATGRHKKCGNSNELLNIYSLIEPKSSHS